MLDEQYRLPGDQTLFQGSENSFEEATFQKLLDVLNRQKLIIIAAVLLCGAVGYFYALRLKPTYAAAAVLSVDTSQANGISLQNVGTAPPSDLDSGAKQENEVRILQSDNLALDVARQLHLGDQPEFRGSGAGAAAAPTQEQLLQAFQSRLKVRIIPKTKLIEVQFSAQDPKLAADVVNTLVSAYITRGYEVRFESAKSASAWMEGKLQQVKQQAEAADRDLLQYQQNSGVIILTTGSEGNKSTILSRVGQLNDAYTAAQVERIQREAKYRSAEAQEASALPTVAPGTALETLRIQQAALMGQYADLSAKFGPEFPRVKELKAQMEQMNHSIQAENQGTLRSVRDQFMSAQRTEDALKQQLDQAKSEAYKMNENASGLALRERAATSTRELYDSLLRRSNEAGIVAGLQANNVQVIDHARVPGSPSGTGRRTIIIGSVLAGLILGIILAIVRNGMDGTILTTTDVKQITGLRLLGSIPFRKPELAGALTSALTLNADNASSEAFRSLRTSLLLGRGSTLKTIVVSSAISGEGKSFTATNLAMVLAQRDAKVLLIDADMHGGRLHEILGASRSPGLSSVLTREVTLQHAINVVDHELALSFLSCGPKANHPADLLDSAAMSDVLRECSDAFDFVIIDTPPVLVASDAVILATMSDAMVVVVRSGLTTRQELGRSGEILAPLRSKVIGTILNDNRESGISYGYGNQDAQKGAA